MIKYHDPFPDHMSAAGSIRHKNIFRVSWSPDYFCNYKCSYCWPGYNHPTRSHLPIDVLISGFKILKTKIEKLNVNHLYLTFSGGEPTLVPNFLDLIREYNFSEMSNLKTLNIITNLTQGKKWWNDFFASTYQIDNVYVTASWHRESINDIILGRKKFVDFFNMIRKFQDSRNNQLGFNITMVIPPSQFDDIYTDALYFRSKNIPTTIRVERKFVNGIMLNHPDYTNDMIESIICWYDGIKNPYFFHKNKSNILYYNDVEQTIALEHTDYIGWKCHAGYDYIIIDPSGNIKRGQYCKDKIIGNIKNDNYELYSEPKKCITVKCGCSTDMNSIKFLET
jgi:MoaA/NifB/PqqE/SkfB family radical SAM enzyme